MRIAFCTDQYLPMLSGLVDSLDTLATQLRKNGHEVRIYAPALPDAEDDPHVFRFPSWSLPGSNGAIIFNAPIGALRDLASFRPDIIHTELFGAAGWLAWRASRKLRVPLVGTDHTFPADYLHYAKLDFPPFPYLVKKYSALYYNRCDIVTAPSHKKLDELRAYGMYRPARVISNPIQEIFRPLPDKQGLKGKLGIGNHAITIFGRIAREKNLDAALDIFANVAERTDAELIFIGDGAYRPHLERRVRDERITSRVKFLGTLRGETLVEAINACDVLLITSTSENQPMTLLQAAACCLPIVAANAGGLPEYVHHDSNGYVIDPKNHAAFADRLVELLEDESRRLQYGANACKLAEPCSPQAVAAQLESLYGEVIQRYQNARN